MLPALLVAAAVVALVLAIRSRGRREIVYAVSDEFPQWFVAVRFREGETRRSVALPIGVKLKWGSSANFTFVGQRVNDSGGNLTGIILNNTGGSPGSSGRYLNGVVTGSNTCLNLETANTSPAPRFDSVLLNCPGSVGAVATSVHDRGSASCRSTSTRAGLSRVSACSSCSKYRMSLMAKMILYVQNFFVNGCDQRERATGCSGPRRRGVAGLWQDPTV